MKRRCLLFGHKIDPNFTDGGYHVCERCQMHEYYNAANNSDTFDTKPPFFEDDGILVKPFYMLRWNLKLKYWQLRNYIKVKFSPPPKNIDDIPF